MTPVHQLIAAEILYQLKGHVRKNQGPCKPVAAPLDVQLDKDDKTVVQPDVMVICDPKTLVKNGRIFGSPDLGIEILSPSTRKRDQTLKLAKYSEAGVRELWYVDPKNLQVMTYDLSTDEFKFPAINSFEEKVPVHIWNDECSVDFSMVYEDIREILET